MKVSKLEIFTVSLLCHFPVFTGEIAGDFTLLELQSSKHTSFFTKYIYCQLKIWSLISIDSPMDYFQL